MIQIIEKKDCCGCNACGDVCPKQAISFINDDEGFWYPKVDMKKCIDCGLCEKICPFLNNHDTKKPIACYAAINSDNDERYKSSSGGVFWMLAKQIINYGGVIFGAAFNEDWMVIHSSATTMEEVRKFQGSKYVQSRVSGCYKEAEIALKQGKKVLFSGTACQIAGLKGYLKKEYDNLLLVDVICHGVPSPGIWNRYLIQLKEDRTITDLNFRDKSNGWKDYCFSAQFSDGSVKTESHLKNLFMQGFIKNLYLRPSCYHCKLKGGRCGCDITLGDFWGVETVLPQIDTREGVSFIIVNTEKGLKYIQTIENKWPVSYEQGVKGNPCLESPVAETKWRKYFFTTYKQIDFTESLNATLRGMRPGIIYRLKYKIKVILSNLYNKQSYRHNG